MDKKLEYRDYTIEANPMRLDAPMRWSVDIDIVRHDPAGPVVKEFSAEETFPTETEAIEACFEFGRQIIRGGVAGLVPP